MLARSVGSNAREGRVKTSINGKPAEWSPEVWALWAEMMVAKEPERVEKANYYTPRPYVDEYNRGSDKKGFVYVIGRMVAFVERRVG
jgi:hypothetical protein